MARNKMETTPVNPMAAWCRQQEAKEAKEAEEGNTPVGCLGKESDFESKLLSLKRFPDENGMVSVAQRRIMFKLRRFAKTIENPPFEWNCQSDAMMDFMNHIMWYHERLTGWEQMLVMMDEDLTLKVRNAKFKAAELIGMYDPDMVQDKPGFGFDLMSRAIEMRTAIWCPEIDELPDADWERFDKDDKDMEEGTAEKMDPYR